MDIDPSQLREGGLAHVRFGSIADIRTAQRDVRFTPESEITEREQSVR